MEQTGAAPAESVKNPRKDSSEDCVDFCSSGELLAEAPPDARDGESLGARDDLGHASKPRPIDAASSANVYQRFVLCANSFKLFSRQHYFKENPAPSAQIRSAFDFWTYAMCYNLILLCLTT